MQRDDDYSYITNIINKNIYTANMLLKDENIIREKNSESEIV